MQFLGWKEDKCPKIIKIELFDREILNLTEENI